MISLTCVSAADSNQTVNDVVQEIDQVNDEILTDDSAGNFTELNTEIVNAQTKTLELNKNYIYDSQNDSKYSNGINITVNDFTIDGNGYAVSGNGQARIFNILATNVTLKNINFINGNGDCGGAIYAENSTLTIINCNFTDNVVESHGGALYFEGGNLSISNSNFINNSAGGDDGAISFSGDELSITESEFINNTAGDDDAALGVSANSAIISKSRFENNYAFDEIGAIYLYNTFALIEESYFVSNNASNTIAAILNADGNLTVNNCYFINNSAKSGRVIRNSMYSTLVLANSTFISSYFKGISIDNNYGTLYLYNNTINTQSSEIHNYGGKILSPCTATVTADTTTFVLGDKTKLTAVITDDNGNLINVNESSAYIYFNVGSNLFEANYNSTTNEYELEYTFNTAGLQTLNLSCSLINITDNQGVSINVVNGTDDFSTLKKVIDASNGTVKLTKDYTFNADTDSDYIDGISINKDIIIDGDGFTINAKNQASIFYVGSGNVTIKNITFINANTSGYGGAIYWEDGEGQITNCIFINNHADKEGGALWIKTDVEISYCSFLNNSAYDGGAIELYSSNGIISHSNFTNNTATKNGAAIDLYNMNNCSLFECLFINNSAAENGGAVNAYKSNAEISECNFTINSAYDGGAIYFEYGNLTVSNSKFTSDTTERFGGALYFEGDELYITESDFIGNSADDDEGAISSIATKTIISKSSFENNNGGEIGAVYMASESALIEESYFINNTAEYFSAILNAGNLTVNNCYFINSSSSKYGIAIRNSQDSILTLSNSTFEINILKGVTIDNNYATLYLYNNTINTQSSEIHNYGGKILSPCTATVKANTTTFVLGDKVRFTAVITDDNGNLIDVNETSTYIYFNVSGNLVEANYNSTTSEYELEYTFNTTGLVTVYFSCSLVNITDNQGVNIKEIAQITAKDASYIINYGGKYSITLKDSSGNLISGEKVTFTLNGKSVGSVKTNANGVATFKLTAKMLKTAKTGKKNLVINIESSNYAATAKTVKITINKEKTKIKAKAKKFKKSKKTKKYKIALKNSKGKAVKKVKVTLKVKGKTYKAKTNAKGKATFKIKKLTKKGKHKATIKFKGNAYYNKCTKKVKIKIK